MIIYHYHPDTHDLLGASEYTPPEGVGLPAHSTDIAPPPCGPSMMQVFNDEEWSLVENYIGETFYEKATGAQVVVDRLGAIPDSMTRLLPPPFPKWNEAAGLWGVDRAAVIKEEIFMLEDQQTPRRIREAALGVDGGWLANINDQIEALRIELNGLAV